MKIDFNKLIENSKDKPSKIQLAREMTEEGLFDSVRSAELMIQYHQSGKAKGCNYALLQYLMKRFNCKGSDIIQWN